MADDDALFDKGMPIRRKVLGPEYVDASMARADEFMMSFQRATTAWAWGWAWGDPTLDRKTRSLMNLAMLTALNRAPEIKLHVKGALNNGVTVEEIKAALLHAMAYCGIPAGLDAFRAAYEVLVSRRRARQTGNVEKLSLCTIDSVRTARSARSDPQPMIPISILDLLQSPRAAMPVRPCGTPLTSQGMLRLSDTGATGWPSITICRVSRARRLRWRSRMSRPGQIAFE
jgi:4-carboxymuconolactone decarboxylase